MNKKIKKIIITCITLAATWVAKEIFRSLMYIIKGLFVTTIEFDSYDDNNAYNYVSSYLSLEGEHIFGGNKGWNWGYIMYLNKASCYSMIGSGDTWMRLNGKYIKINHSADSKSNLRKIITISYLGRDRLWETNLRQQVLNELTKTTICSKSEDSISIFVSNSGEFNIHRPLVIKRRELNTIFVPENKKRCIINAIDNYENSRVWYEERSIPYRLGILIHSVPGLGKSSLIKAVASHYGKNIYYVRASDMYNIEELFDILPKGAFVVIEDIDSVDINKDRENVNTKAMKTLDSSKSSGKRDVSLSEILNKLDGLVACEDRVVFFTTNHVNKLDKALIRPGRIDLVVELDELEQNEFEAFIKHFYKEDLPKGLVLDKTYKSISKIQSEILTEKLNFEQALKRFTELGGEKD